VGLSLSRGRHAILVVFCIPFFCSTRAASFFRPDRIFPSPSRAAAVKDGASSTPPPALPGGHRRAVPGLAKRRPLDLSTPRPAVAPPRSPPTLVQGSTKPRQDVLLDKGPTST